MIIYLAGNGCKAEDISQLKEREQWGVLLSYKDTKTKDKIGSKRFQRLMKRKK